MIAESTVKTVEMLKDVKPANLFHRVFRLSGCVSRVSLYFSNFWQWPLQTLF